MSNAVSALNKATYQGFVSVSDMDPSGMITVRGDLSASAVKKAVKSVTGCPVPDVRKIETSGEMSVAWMSPDELLILCPYVDAGVTEAKLSKALSKVHNLALNVSDARARISLVGTDVREAMAKITPADMAVDSFAPGDFRRSRMAQIPAAFWMVDDSRIEVVCFRSVAQYAFDLLKTASLPGSEVGYY